MVSAVRSDASKKARSVISNESTLMISTGALETPSIRYSPFDVSSNEGGQASEGAPDKSYLINQTLFFDELSPADSCQLLSTPAPITACRLILIAIS